MAQTLFAVITDPFGYINRFCPKRDKAHSIIGLCVAGFSLIQYGDINMAVYLTVLTILCLALISFLYALTIDFFAQIFGANGKSLALFSGINLTLIAFGLFPLTLPIKVFAGATLAGLAKVGIITFLVCWQYQLIRHLYGLTPLKTGVVLMAPLGLNIALIVLVFAISMFG